MYYLLELNSFHILFQGFPKEISIEEPRTNVTDTSDSKYQTISPQHPDSSQHGNESSGDSKIVEELSELDLSGDNKGHSETLNCPLYDPKVQVLYL